MPHRNFDASDRAEHRARLVARIRSLGGYVPDPPSGEPSELEIAFLERVVAFETSPVTTHRQWLAHRGWIFPPPWEIAEADLSAELWRLIAGLAVARVFLEQTDHLTDAELYHHLWHKVLAADAPDFCRSPDEACHWDVADAGNNSREWLAFFASDDERAEYAEMFPGDELPPRRALVACRDHRLPKRD